MLHSWILNNNLRYASTSKSSTAAAIKLLYRIIGKIEADTMLEKINSDAQEINLPEDAIRTVIHCLEDSNGLLPVKERLFQEWNVGL